MASSDEDAAARERLRRWRLVLGGDADGTGADLGSTDTGLDGALAALYGSGPGGGRERPVPAARVRAGRVGSQRGPLARRHPRLLSVRPWSR